MIIQSTSRAEGAVPIHAIVAAQAAVVWGRNAARIPDLDNDGRFAFCANEYG